MASTCMWYCRVWVVHKGEMGEGGREIKGKEWMKKEREKDRERDRERERERERIYFTELTL